MLTRNDMKLGEAAMRVDHRRSPVWALLFIFIFLSLGAIPALGQASYTAQIRGVVKDASGAMVPKANISITNDATGISTTASGDSSHELLRDQQRLNRNPTQEHDLSSERRTFAPTRSPFHRQFDRLRP